MAHAMPIYETRTCPVLAPSSVGEYVFYVFSKKLDFLRFCFVAYVFSNNDRQCLHLEVYQIASLHYAL